MKKVFKQIINALAYFGIFLGSSLMTSLVGSFIYGFVKALQYSNAGMNLEELSIENSGIQGVFLLISSLLTLLILFIISKAKKSSLPKEADIKKASVKETLLTATGAIGGMFFMNFILYYLPIPESLINDLNSGVSSLSTYPVWLAFLVNALLVPIVEEVVFRGFIFNRLNKAMPSFVAALISSAIFGMAHGGIVWGIWAFAMAMIICLVRIKSGSIVPGIIFHMIINTFSVVDAYFSPLDGMTPTVMLILTIAGGILLAVYAAGIFTDKNSPAKKKAEVIITSVAK